MGWNDEYMIKVFLTSAGSEVYGTTWGYLVRHYDQKSLEFTQNFSRASRFKNQEAAANCVDELKAQNADFESHISKVEFMPVRE